MTIENITVDRSYVIMTIEELTADKPSDILRI